MTEGEPVNSGVRFERIEVGTPQALQMLLENFRQFPVTAPGLRPAANLSFDLRWRGGHGLVLPENIRLQVREAYLKGWEDKIAPRWAWRLTSEQLENWKDWFISNEVLTPKQVEKLGKLQESRLKEDRKGARREIMPFPGVLMTFEGFNIRDGKVIIRTRVGNYAELDKSHPDFMKKFPGHKRRLRQMTRGIGVQVLTETSDGYHIFGLVAKSMGEGSIGTMGITPGISDEQMKFLIKDAKGKKKARVPGDWLFKSIEKDISEADELNLEGIPGAKVESSHMIGIVPDPEYGWMTLVVFCKLNVTADQIENAFGTSPSQEHKNLIFVKNNPQALTTLLLRQGVYPTVIGGYHAYFRQFQPDLLERSRNG